MIKGFLTLFFLFANPRTKNLLDFLIFNQINNVQVPWLVQIDVLEWRAGWTCLGLDNGVMWRPNDKPTIMRCQLTIGQINQNGPNSTRFAYGGSGGAALNCRPTVFGSVWPALGHVLQSSNATSTSAVATWNGQVPTGLRNLSLSLSGSHICIDIEM